MAEQHEEALLTPEQLVEFFAERGMVIGINRVREQLANKQLPGYRVGDRWITPLPWLKKWLQGPDMEPVEPVSVNGNQFIARRQA